MSNRIIRSGYWIVKNNNQPQINLREQNYDINKKLKRDGHLRVL